MQIHAVKMKIHRFFVDRFSDAKGLYCSQTKFGWFEIFQKIFLN